MFVTALGLLVLWILGLVNSYALGGLIHILLALAIAIFAINAVRERRAR